MLDKAIYHSELNNIVNILDRIFYNLMKFLIIEYSNFQTFLTETVQL